ncbi:hypothetical protein RF11_07566 [Thelohanellus kitauei]|uniref:FLYWCH-type domain-containing protein n=1 Tax=Thelohanellus kitauei TaxID=669202 RepID=A0A0C2M5E8_THEKT|nr:hypothetical protein RF11_07566 [Thelohanellus kitauei]
MQVPLNSSSTQYKFRSPKDLTIIFTEKGKPQLIYYGHSYRINRRNERIDKIYWRCVRKECKAKLSTNLDCTLITDPPTEHAEAPNPNASDVKIIKNNMRNMALESSLRPRNIISHALRHTNPAISAILPSYTSMQRTIQNVRARNSFPYQNPLNCREFLLPDEFKITHRNERFLLSDTYQVDTGRIIIFCTDRGKQLMSRSNRVFFDGTFKTVPEIFYQLFTIHCDISGNVLPCAFVLMEKNYL